ncbi:phosphatidylinositide phosphatase SAC2 isoform X2 [Neocloeon triangulifer]|uniref:phosphatidylinositide phosphatase SAC2 isoform X2 n=1 Tax=Neocloeon triangulifer TaxID=2078957 RepID=UPI00286F7391|nr:phosphatidylinositide phosphatase SAC2 isoform X2 [Neocloeon triangulifer]
MACRATGLRAIELFRTDDFYILQSGEHSLWWDRNTALCTPKSGWDLVDAVNPECLGIFFGLVGKIELNPGLLPRLILIKSVESVGQLPGMHTVYKIKAVAFLNILGPDVTQQELGLESCTKHCNRRQGERCVLEQPAKTSLAKTWSSIKSASNTIKNTTVQAAQLAASQVKPLRKRDNRSENEKFERRMLDELSKIWDDSQSFYFSPSGDLTNSQQRQWIIEQKEVITLKEQPEYKPPPLWKKLDQRFFWNQHMLKEIINHDSEMANFWILPVIQGFVQVEKCKVDLGRFDRTREAMEPVFETFVLTVISRRSRFRAGTRYNRRGVDEEGKVANYVETEQIISYLDHQVSFVQVRGSVPVYWSQPGIKYRPPPRIDKGPAETREAFEKHFNEELATYGHICIINLVEQTGREKIIADTYTENVCDFSCPDLTYCLFDFHEYCRGMHFENVSILLSHLLDVINEQKFCWLDKQGRICLQFGVFRVNCIDCLDRTNVVQTAIAKTVMEIVFTKLGLIAPEKPVPANIRNAFQVLWANNGDAISRQYAGTNALKGDYTRTGERKFSGLMKDSVNSASRYYLGRFRDAERQAAIDLMLGNPIPEEIFSGGDPSFTEDITASAEQVKHVIEDSKKLLLPDPAECVGAWGLIDADQGTGNPNETDMDIILLLTSQFYCVAWYDEEADRVSHYQYVPLEDITHIEIGQCQLSTNSLFKTSKSPSFCIRIYYQQRNDDGEMEPGFFHIFRSANLRFFNNLAVAITSEEEAIESIKYICETFLGLKNELQVERVSRLERKKSKIPREIRGHQPSSSFLNLPAHIPRNFSDKSLSKVSNTMGLLKNEMSEKFSKITSIGSKKQEEKVEMTTNNKPKPIFVVGSLECEETSFSAEGSFDLPDLPKASLRHPDCDQMSLAAGILMGCRKGPPVSPRVPPQNSWLQPPSGKVLKHSRSDLSLSDSSRSPRKTPEIMVQAPEGHFERTPPKKENMRINIRNTLSERDLSLNLSSSQSESALRSNRGFGSVLSSPSSMKDNAFLRFSKGLQTFSANLDPRKLAKLNSPLQGPQQVDPESLKVLQDKFKGCKTRLVAI